MKFWLAYKMAIIASEWKIIDRIIQLKEFLKQILNILKDEKINKELTDIFNKLDNQRIDEDMIDKAYINTILSLYFTFKERNEFINLTFNSKF